MQGGLPWRPSGPDTALPLQGAHTQAPVRDRTRRLVQPQRREHRGQAADRTNLRGKVSHWKESVSKPARPRAPAATAGPRRGGHRLPVPPRLQRKARARAMGRHGAPAPPDQRRWGWRSRTGHGATTTDGLSFWFSKEKNRVRCEFLRHRLRAVLIGFPK